MRRSDRLFDLIQIMRDGRLHRATDLAQRLAVSDRTIWRDMATLMASGMPVEGERGVGYILRAPITLPPMMLTASELEVLRQGLRHVATSDDPVLSRAARTLAAKVASVTPQPIGPETDDLFQIPNREASRAAPHLPMLRRAIREKEVLHVSYLEPGGQESHSDIRPLRLKLNGKVWSLIAWCEGRNAHRVFRVDRIMAVGDTGETYPDDPQKTLAAYLALSPDPPETQSSDPAGS
ncbi:MAG: YafY family protein [bacterium]